MQRFKIHHRTIYNFTGPVQLQPHRLLVRPREDHESRVESSILNISPAAIVRWHRDVEDNSVAIATFSSSAAQLFIESIVVVQQYNEAPLDFVIEDSASHYPFSYSNHERVVLAPYMEISDPSDNIRLASWIAQIHPGAGPVETYVLLKKLCRHIHDSFRYQVREEPGVQSPQHTLQSATGSCRDFANLLMEACRSLGLASRFVSGYLYTGDRTSDIPGATHAWTEVYIPGAGWKGIDPTTGEFAGKQHIAVAVSRLPEQVPPVAGSFIGLPGANLEVGVWVSAI